MDRKALRTRYNRIKELRSERHLTQVELGKILGCAQRTYSDYENGRIDIPTWVLIGMADYYGVSVDYILGRANN